MYQVESESRGLGTVERNVEEKNTHNPGGGKENLRGIRKEKGKRKEKTMPPEDQNREQREKRSKEY